jgi:hypothetical protein
MLGNVSEKCIVKHLMTQQPLRIIHDKDGTYFVCYGEGLTFKCFAAALTLKAAKSVCADINRRPWYYGA